MQCTYVNAAHDEATRLLLLNCSAKLILHQVLAVLTLTWHLQDAITRVQELDKSGRISGVMDDRGKVCYACTIRT